MASSTHATITQEDFSSGAVPSVAPHLIPANGVQQIRNGLLDEDGSIYRRGGSETHATHDEKLTMLWRGSLGPGLRTLAADDDSFLVDVAGVMTAVRAGGMAYPKPLAETGRYLFIGGGYIYAGSLKTAPYTTGTVSVTNGSAVVTGSGTTWNTLVDAGMLFQRGNERVYRIASVDSVTQVTLAEPYEGTTAAGLAYTFSPLYPMTTADPYPRAEIYAVAQNRLVWAEGNLLKFAPLVAGFPANHNAHDSVDEWELPEPIVGHTEVGANLLVFTTAGTWILQGIGYEIVDSAGNPQQRLTKLSDHVLLDGAGIAYWEQGVIAPTTDGVFLFDGISAPVRLSGNIDSDYRAYVRLGYRAGQATVFNSHYFLPLISSTSDPKRLYSVQLDRQAFDRRRRITHPWSWHDGSGAELSALVSDLSADRKPLLLGAQANAAGDVVDITGYFSPTVDNGVDSDGTAFDFDVITRDFSTGNGTDNSVRKLRARYEMAGAVGAAISFAYTDGASEVGGAAWDQVTWDNFVWAESGADFTSLDCDGGESEGRDTHVCRVGKRVRFIRFRIRSTGEVHALRLRSLEVFIKPSRATRR